MAVTHREWVENEIYQDLLQNPCWVYCAFESCKEGEILKKHHKDLIHQIVMKHIDKAPMYDSEFRTAWRVREFLPVIKASFKQAKLVLKYD